MNIGGLAIQAFGGAVKELDGKGKEDVRAVFRQDSFISGLLMSAPAAVLSILLVFSSPYFHSTLITCSLRDVPEYNKTMEPDYRSYRYDYSFFDYNFIQSYCYANMYHYQVNRLNGTVDHDSKESLIFLKLFPYVLTTFSLLGGFTKGLWELYDRRHSSQLSLIVDGIEEAVSELFAGLGLIYQKMEQERERNETCLLLTKIDKRRKVHERLSQPPGGISKARKAQAKHANGTVITNGRMGHGNETDFATKMYLTDDRVRKVNLKLNQQEAVNHIREYSNVLKTQLETIWDHYDTKTKFVELEDLMVSKLNSYKFASLIFFYRFVSLVITVGCGSATLYFYVLNLPEHESFNCKLPESYWYTHEGNVWKTTKCYIKATVFWEYVSYLLFIFYAICFVYQIGAHVTNVRNWRKSCKMIKYMPLQADDLVADYETSDLHCIMALANENNRSRVTIWAGDKVTSALSDEEMYKFLPVMMEMIVWKSSDENVEDLIKNIVKKEER